MKKKVAWLFIIFFHFVNTQAQYNGTNHQPSFALGVIDQLHSVELNENRLLNIYLPEGYSPDSAATYPVIYLLDGSANEDFVHIAGLVQFLTMIGAMPPSIVAGIANVDRKRDFTFFTNLPDYRKELPTSGGSSRFIAFIEKELQPYIQKKYKVNGVRTIIGQSLGGLLATEVLLKKPALFDNYLIVSPSLWWDNESLLHAAPSLLQKQTDKTMHVFISVGTEGAMMENDARRLDSVLHASGKKNLHTMLVPLPEENHRTILHNAAYKLLVLLYRKENDNKK
jgi:predicted alpha/beta superfamily hydrolase